VRLPSCAVAVTLLLLAPSAAHARTHRLDMLPARGASGGGASLPAHARGLVGDEVEQDINQQSDDQEETYVAVQPNDPRRVIAGVNPAGTANPQAWISNNFMRPGTGVARTLPNTSRLASGEGGGTAALSLCCDPTFAADTLGNLWYGVVAADPNALNPLNDPTSHIVVNRVAAGSTDFQPVNTALPKRTSNLQDKVMITIDDWGSSPKLGTLYAAWTENSPSGQNIVISQCATRPDPAACDNPNNWSTPTSVTDTVGGDLYASVATAPDGTVYVAWWDTGPANQISIDRCAAAAACQTAGGWGPDTRVRALNPDTNPASGMCPTLAAPSRGVTPTPYVDVGPDGTVWVSGGDLNHDGTTACSNPPAATDDTWFVFVTHGATPGAFPTGAQTRTFGAAGGGDAFYPTLTVDPSTGEVSSTFYATGSDRRASNQMVVNTTDGGQTFNGPVTITSTPIDFSGSRTTLNDYGDYQGADSAQGLLFPVWTDNRTGNADLFMRTAPIAAGAPETNIDSGPSGPTNNPSPQFGFSSTDPRKADVAFECSVDGGAFGACASPLTLAALPDGAHSFAVRSHDNSGNIDATPASRQFTVDTVAPDTVLARGISGLTRRRRIGLSFSATEPATFECAVDRAAFAACASPFTTPLLRDGSHSLAVRARDPAGNIDPTPATRSVRVDTTRPRVRLLRVRRGRLTLRISEPGKATIRVQRPRGRSWRTVRTRSLRFRSTKARRTSLGRLRRHARYRVTVSVVDLAGNRSATRRARFTG